MSRSSGFTLIEAMVTVALMGIVTVGLLQAGTSARLRANERLLHERATQVLEFEAEAVSSGVLPDPEVERALLCLTEGSFCAVSLEQARAKRGVVGMPLKEEQRRREVEEIPAIAEVVEVDHNQLIATILAGTDEHVLRGEVGVNGAVHRRRRAVFGERAAHYLSGARELLA